MLKSKTWQHEITGSDGNVILFDVNIPVKLLFRFCVSGYGIDRGIHLHDIFF